MLDNSIIYFLNTHGVFVLILAVFVLLYVRKKDREVLGHTVIVFLITIVTVFLLKELFNRPRPYVEYGVEPLAGLDYFASFPSAHAAMSFAVATTVALHKRKVGIFLLILATLISLGRVAAQVHYPSDIAFGVLIGVMVALFFDTFHVRRRKRGLTR